MKKPYRSFVTVGQYEVVDGWGVVRTIVDCRFTIWMVSTHNFIQANKTYDFELFMNYVCEVPVFCFVIREQAVEFARLKSNRYPIDMQLKALKWRKQYWYSTILEQYCNMAQFFQQELEDKHIKI